MKATRHSPRAAWWNRVGTSRPTPDRLSDLFLVACIALIPVTAAARAFLPARFSYDAQTLGRIAAGEFNPSQDLSYLYVGRIYGALGAADRPWVAAVIGLVLAALALYPALARAQGVARPAAYALVGLYVVTASVYLGQYSKDTWVLLVVLVALWARPGWRGDLALVAACAVYATWFRGYWWLILLFYVTVRVSTARALRRRTVLLMVVGAVAGVTILAPPVLGVDISSVRDSVNLERQLSPDATTAISSLDLGGGPTGQVLASLVSLVELIVPVPLMTTGSVQYVAYAAAIVLVWAMFVQSAFAGPERILDGRPAADQDTRALRAVLLAVAVVTTQSFFEPDYGSYLRHLTPILPLVIAATVGRPGSPFLLSSGTAGRQG